MLTIINVKEALADALIRLTETKRLLDITVQDIAVECNTSRRTFYNHFRDKYDLANWVYESKTNRILESFDASRSWDECLLDVYDNFRNNLAFFKNISSFSGQNSFAEHFYKYHRKYFIEYIGGRYGKDALSDELMYAIEYNIYGQYHMCVKWMNEGAVVPPEKMVEFNVSTIPAQLKKYLYPRNTEV